MIKIYLQDHGKIAPKQCRELLGLGESDTDRVEISKLLRKWSDLNGFLDRVGKPPKTAYFLRGKNERS